MQDNKTNLHKELSILSKDVARQFHPQNLYLEDRWFERQRGVVKWAPVSWQGWILYIGYLLLVINIFFRVYNNSESIVRALFVFIPLFAACTAVFILICYLTEGKSSKQNS